MANYLKFFLWWLIVLAASYAFLSVIDAVPPEIGDFNGRMIEKARSMVSYTRGQTASISPTGNQETISGPVSRPTESVLPDRVVIEKIGVDSPVVNPESRDTSVLDGALLRGVVRYPGSGGLTDNSTMFLFGHSTSFQTVYNEAFKAFNRLGELQIGDVIRVWSGADVYLYRVFSVAQVDKNKALVELNSGERILTLSTCDTFGSRSDRFVVQARFVRVLPST